MASIKIFTDGSSRGNPGRGGWGSVIVYEPLVGTHPSARQGEEGGEIHVTELGGGEKMTTNNRMELTAALNGLVYARSHTRSHGTFDDSKDADIIVYTDSSYVINGITKWIHGWKHNGWKTKTKDDVLNKDLWMPLSDEISDKKVQWKYVGGHIGIVGNERCDHIATAFADGMEIHLYDGPLSGYDLPKILDISHDQFQAATKKSDSARSRAKAHSYISSVGGVIEVHRTWAECEKRVKGVRGARFKKSLDSADEAKILEEFEAFLV